MENEKFALSVIVVTYNHERYIRQCLDSILMQKVDFKYEVLIGDDCSTDKTAEIIKEYKKNYPNIIKTILRKKNIGGTNNAYSLYMKSKGEYFATIEGDDYWTDPYKLQKQIDFLRNNKQYSACTCNFEYVDEHGNPFDDLKAYALRSALYCDNKIYTVDDYNQSKLPSHAGTRMAINLFAKGVNCKIYYKAHKTVGDFTIALLLLSKGPIYKLDDCMSCYRHVPHTGSSWSSSVNKNPYAFYELFLYHSRLESYAKKHLNMQVTLRNYKGINFMIMVTDYLAHPSNAKKTCIYKMLSITQEKHLYFFDMIKAVYPSSIPHTIRKYIVQGESVGLSKNTWQNFFETVKGKDLILFGAGIGCKDLLDQYYPKLKVKFIVDRSASNQGSYLYGYKVLPLDSLKSLNPQNTVIMITPVNYFKEIICQLEQEGFNNYYVYGELESNRLHYWAFNKFFKHPKFIG